MDTLNRVLLVFVLLVVTLPATAGATPAAVPGPGRYHGKIDRFVLEQLAANHRTSVFVKLAADARLDAAGRISDRVERLQFVYDTLTAHATRSQEAITETLDGQGVQYQSFWINNSLYVHDADLALVQTLADRGDVAYVRGNREVIVHLPVTRKASPDEVEVAMWNVRRIDVYGAWITGNTGQGIVVASIDSGVRYTHQALVNQYRGNNGDGTFSHDYNWFDPNLVLPVPYDPLGHGTHTMGTMVGGDGFGPMALDVGVAPGARWITAGLGNVPTDEELISAAQWILCPTRVDGTDPDCSKAPHVVNNSWGGLGGDDWYQSYVNTWLEAGIVPVFAIGNYGPWCRTAGSPGDYPGVIGVGATTPRDVLAWFSSKGPGAFRRLKPDFVAPGDEILSSVNYHDMAYEVSSGTSMAAPHVVGTIALMLSANPDASLNDLYTALRTTAVTDLGLPPGRDTCGGSSYDVYPNTIYGWGRIDAAAAVYAVTP